MRIVAGRWRGRRLRNPPDLSTRPTADRVREAWMSIVLPHLVGARVLDLFAGSGALGLEALSRGAGEAHFVETSPRALTVLQENIEFLGALKLATLHRVDALQFVRSLRAREFDVAFVDPPYKKNLSQEVVRLWHEVPFAKVLGVEHSGEESMLPGGDTRRYGDSAVTFYRG